MGKLSKEELARYSGAGWAIRLAEDKGIEAAKAELEQRGALNIPLGVKKTDIDQFCESEKTNTLVTVMMMTVVTLRDEFGFGAERIHRFIDRFNTKTKCLLADYVNWEELRDQLAEETGIRIELPEVFLEKGA
jgi:hypothetical protein